jgi:methylmalonyl-CoA/ethylmalonyl-CoA epimerase
MTDISHIGIAVKNLDDAVKIFSEILGYGPEHVGEVTDQNVKVAVFAPENNSGTGRIELLTPTNETSPIKRYLDKNGQGIHHLALKVSDIEKKLEELRSKGFRLIDEIPRLGAGGKKIAFIHPSSACGTLIELSE